ncbi:MAG: hypothetical protein Kow0042_01270 [Calditrichia bacterium]
MLEVVIDNIIKKIRAEVVTPQMDRILLNYLMTRNIPDSVKHFFDQEVELWLREEAEKFTTNDRFDYDMPEVRVLIDKIFDILKQTATFHINKFNQLLERAIKLEANYLIRPHQTLTQFLFKDSFVITTMDVYDMLKYFDKFQYYKDALTDYFNLKYLREISQNQFEELINEIDHQVFSKDKINTTLKTVKIIINFLNEGREPSNSLETDVLIKAFQDRNLNDYVQLIQAEERDGITDISISELEALLRTGKTSRERKIPEEKAEITVEKIPDIETVKPEIQVEEITVKAPVEIPEPVVVEEEYEEEEEELVETAIPTAADQLADVVAEKIKGDRLEDLNQMISSKQRKKFIKKLFKKNERQYQQFTDTINKLPTWKQASILIDDIFYKIGINPYSKDALEFSDLIYNRYFPKDRPVNREDFA